MHINFRKLIPVLLILVVFAVSLEAQTGKISGVVKDAETGDPLPGANVVVGGDNPIGAASNFDGEYTITGVPAGTYSLSVTYIGYKKTEKQVTVDPNELTIVDIRMRHESVRGEDVVVTAQARGQTEAINQQISSDAIKNIVSSSKIHELPDENAAAALSRLPGVSLMEGDKVAIRGIQAKNNMVLVNGIQLPSTDMEDRSTNLGFISSNMLSSIEVTKVVTPDMDANAIGGTINLRLREAPEEFQLDLLTQGSFNTQDRTYPGENFKVWGSASNRFFDNKLGVFVQGNMKRSNAGVDVGRAGYNRDQGTEPYGEGIYQMANFVYRDEENIVTDMGGSLLLDYKLPNGKIILQNTIAHTINDNSKYRQEMDFTVSEVAYALNRDKHNKELLVNSLQADYDFGPIQARLGLSHSYSDKNTDIRYGDPGNEFGFQNAAADTTFVTENGERVTYESKRRFMTPADVQNVNIKSDDWKDAPIFGWCVDRSEEFEQHLYNSTLDFTIPASFFDKVSGNFKIGGKFTFSDRKNDVNESYHRTGDNDFYNAVDSTFLKGEVLSVMQNPLTFADMRNYDYDRGEYFFEGDYEFQYALDHDKMDDFMTNVKDGWPKPRHEARSLRDDFEGEETFAAGYVMGNFDIGQRLKIIGGGRFEHYNMEYDGNFVYCTHSVDGDANDTLRSIDRDDNTFFPNLQIKYSLTDWADLRVAYSKSISRPDYQAVMPSIYYTPGENAASGNPSLDPSISTNYDLYLSMYENKIGLFTLGGFYKKIDNVFFSTQIYYPHLSRYNIAFPDSAGMVDAGLGIQPNQVPGRNSVVQTYVNNPNPAYVRGFEVSWQTNFWYLPKPLNSLVFSVNYTRTWSEMDYQQIENVDSTYQEGRFTRHVYKTVENVRTTSLLGQGDHILNLTLGLNHKGFSGRLSYNLRDNILSSVGIRPEEDEYTRTTTSLDLSLKQKLPLEGLMLGLNARNLLHRPVETYQIFRRSNDTPIVENGVETRYEPRTISLYLRYNL